MYYDTEDDSMLEEWSPSDRQIGIAFILVVSMLYFGLGVLLGFWIWGTH